MTMRCAHLSPGYLSNEVSLLDDVGWTSAQRGVPERAPDGEVIVDGDWIRQPMAKNSSVDGFDVLAKRKFWRVHADDNQSERRVSRSSHAPLKSPRMRQLPRPGPETDDVNTLAGMSVICASFSVAFSASNG